MTTPPRKTAIPPGMLPGMVDPEQLRGAMAAILPPTISAPPIPPRPRRNPAGSAFEHLSEQIKEFESTLSQEEEVGGIFIGAPGDIVFHITKFYAVNMDLLVFEGLDENRKSQRLVQHVSQLSILLKALPKLNDTPRRIGFQPPEVEPTAEP